MDEDISVVLIMMKMKIMTMTKMMTNMMTNTMIIMIALKRGISKEEGIGKDIVLMMVQMVMVQISMMVNIKMKKHIMGL